MSGQVIPIRREFIDGRGDKWVWDAEPHDHDDGVIPCPGAVEPLRLPPRPGRKAEMMRLGIRYFGAILTLALLLCASTASARGSQRGYQRSNVSAGFGSGGGWQGFSPTWIPGLALWLRADLGVTAVAGPVTATGTTPPTVTLAGTPTATQTAAATPYVELDCTTLGILGTSKYTLKLNGATVATNVASASSGVSIPGSGLTAGWAAGASAVNDVYTANVVASAWADQSGNGNTLSQGTTSQRPDPCVHRNWRSTRRSGVLAASTSLSTVSTSSAIMGSASSAERLFVGKAASDPASGTESVVDTNGVQGNIIPFSDGKIYDAFGSTVRKVYAKVPSLASPFIYDAYSAASDWQGYVNGSSQFATGTNTVAFQATAIQLFVSGGVFSSMPLSAYMMYTRKLDVGERYRLTRYLGNIYGIAVAP